MILDGPGVIFSPGIKYHHNKVEGHFNDYYDKYST